MKSIEIIGKIKASQAATFMADYLKAACAIALKANGWFIKDWHQAVAIAATIGQDYSEKLPTDMSDQEKAKILDDYGSMPAPGRLTKGMDAKSLEIPKSQ